MRGAPDLDWDILLSGLGQWLYWARGQVRSGAGELVSWAILRSTFMLKIIITVLANPDRRGDLQPFDLRLEATAPVKMENIPFPELSDGAALSNIQHCAKFLACQESLSCCCETMMSVKVCQLIQFKSSPEVTSAFAATIQGTQLFADANTSIPCLTNQYFKLFDKLS